MHIEDSDLALLALGEGDAADEAHVESCSVCHAEVESLATVNNLMARGGPMPVEAPAYLWPAIKAAIAENSASPAPTSSEPPDSSTRVSASGELGDTTKAAPAAQPSDLASRRAHREAERSASRRFSGVSLLGAAAVGAGIMWLGVSVLDDQEQPGESNIANEDPAQPADGQTADTSIVATAELDALEDSVEPASAEIIDRDGQRVLRVDAASLPAVDDGYLQVWLLEDDVAGMVTIGALTASGEEFVLPEGLSTDTFTTVDVSIEHYDGNPEHSGESLWRGPITSA
ncbi:MAG: anti-sigma factor [Ornithinimicrobium sp.]